MNAELLGLLLGAIGLGALHGVEPGHGWPIAAAYALDRSRIRWHGFVASVLLGVGHLISSLAVVAVYFWAKSYFQLTELNQPITVPGGLRLGGPVSLAAGLLLLVLAVREYRGHGHGHDRDHDHEHGGDEEELPVHGHGGEGHGHGGRRNTNTLVGIAWLAFLLGFAHEEEFEIIGMCAGSSHCLALMSAYAVTVIVVIVALTLLAIAGYRRFESRVERYREHLPAVSATILALMAVAFIFGWI